MPAGVGGGLETGPTKMPRHATIRLGRGKFTLGIFMVEALLKVATHGANPGVILPTAAVGYSRSRRRG
jgi:hypothetical protein